MALRSKDILLDNGLSVISYLRSQGRGRKLIITFDPMTANDVNAPGFGESFFLKRGYDILVVQKRRDNWYQDLSLEEFICCVNKVSRNYDDLIAYGSSMGAYAVLYFCSLLRCRILSMSPRISIHPRSLPTEAERFKYEVPYLHHSLLHVVDRHAEPLVIYDPNVMADKHYVEGEVLQAFPRARLIRSQYSGHPVGQTLMEMGALKNFVLLFVEKNEVNYSSLRLNKRQSKTYLANFAVHAAQVGKHKVAVNLLDRAISIDSTIARFYVQKSLSLGEIGDIQRAVECARFAVNCSPLNSGYRIHLSNLLYKAGDVHSALEQVNDVIARDTCNSEAYVQRSVFMMALGITDGAIESAQAAADLCPDNAEIRVHLSSILDISNDTTGSLKEAKAAIAIDGTNARAFVRASVSLFKLHRYKEALESARRAAECDPTNVQFRNHLVNISKEVSKRLGE